MIDNNEFLNIYDESDIAAIIGWPGTGKTRLIVNTIIPHIVKSNESFLLVDAAGLAYAELKNMLRENGYYLKILDIKNLKNINLTKFRKFMEDKHNKPIACFINKEIISSGLTKIEMLFIKNIILNIWKNQKIHLLLDEFTELEMTDGLINSLCKKSNIKILITVLNISQIAQHPNNFKQIDTIIFSGGGDTETLNFFKKHAKAKNDFKFRMEYFYVLKNINGKNEIFTINKM